MFAVALLTWSALIGMASAQAVQSWATVLDDAGRSDSGDFVLVDSTGDAIVGGISQTASGDADVRLARISPAGVVIWSQRIPFGAPNSALGLDGLTLDPAGNILAVVNHSLGGQESRVVTVKVSGAGAEIWRATFDTPGGVDSAAGIVRDAAGQVFVGGTIQQGVNGVNGQSLKAFIVAYGANGNLLWQDTYDNGQDQESIGDITRDPASGAIYIAGSASGQNAGPLLLRYDPSGRRRWAKKFPTLGGRNGAGARKVRVGPDGHVVMASVVAPGGIGSIDIQVTKVDATSGKALWSTLYGDPVAEDYVFDLAIDSLANVTIFARRLAGFGTGHPLVVRYTPNGQLSWDVVDPQTDGAFLAFALDAAGAAYVSGPHRVPFGMFVTYLWRTTRYDGAGQPIWAVEYDGSPTIPTNGTPHSLAVASGGDVIVTGEVNGDIHVVSYDQP